MLHESSQFGVFLVYAGGRWRGAWRSLRSAFSAGPILLTKVSNPSSLYSASHEYSVVTFSLVVLLTERSELPAKRRVFRKPHTLGPGTLLNRTTCTVLSRRKELPPTSRFARLVLSTTLVVVVLRHCVRNYLIIDFRSRNLTFVGPLPHSWPQSEHPQISAAGFVANMALTAVSTAQNTHVLTHTSQTNVPPP